MIRNIIILVALCVVSFSAFAAPPIIWNGEFAKTLKPNIKLQDSARIYSGDSDDPTSVAKEGEAGSLYIRSNGLIYRKSDAGSSTNWQQLLGVDSLLNDLFDVNITSVQDDDQIVYDTATSKWVNRPAHSLFHDVSSATGLISGGTLSINGGDPTKYDVSAGVGYIVDNYTDPLNPTVTQVSFGPLTAVTLSTVATDGDTIIAINSSGNPVETDEIDFEDSRDTIILGGLVHQGGVIIDEVPSPFNHIVGPHDTALDFMNAIGVVNVTGNVFSANGANLSIDKSGGKAFLPGSNFSISKKSPNVSTQAAQSPVTFIYTWRDGVGGYNSSTGNTLIVPGDYDDGTGGASSPNGSVTPSSYTVQRIYLGVSGLVVVHFGQDTYASLADAEARYLTEAFDPNPDLQGTLLRGFLIVRGNATDLSDTAQAVFISANRFGDSGGGANVTSATSTLQNAYDNSTDPEIVLDSVLGGVSITDASTPVSGNLFEVQNNARTTEYLSASSTGVGIQTGTISDLLTVGPWETPSIPGLESKTVGVYGDGAAYFRGRDVTNDIEFLMGTSTTGVAFAGSITTHPFQIRTENETKIEIDTDNQVRFLDPIGDTNFDLIFDEGGTDVFSIKYEGQSKSGDNNLMHFRSELNSNNMMTFRGDNLIGIDQESPDAYLDINGDLKVDSTIRFAIKTVSSSTYSILATNQSGDHTILLDASSNSVTATLPDATANTGIIYTLKSIDITNTTTIDTTSSQTIDGSLTYVFSKQYEAIRVQSNGANWFII